MKAKRSFSRWGCLLLQVASLLAGDFLAVAGDEMGAGRDVPGDEILLMIVTTETIRTSSTRLAVFAEHKRGRLGTCAIITEADWGGGVGDEAAENLRAWLIANTPALHTRYILLIGDPRPGTGNVPMKSIRPGPAYAPVPTDMYYSALDFDWTDFLVADPQRTLPGSIQGTLRVGRIPVYSRADIAHLDAILDRTMAHERSFGWQAWRRKVLAAGAVVVHDNVAGSGYPGVYGCHLTEELQSRFHPGVENWRVVTLGEAEDFSSTLEPPRIVPADHPLTAATLRDRWNEGSSGIVVVMADGNQDGCHRRVWRDDPNGNLAPDLAEIDEEPLLDAERIALLSAARPPIVVQLTPHAAAPSYQDNLANLLLRHAAVAVVAPTAGIDFHGGHRGDRGPEAYGLYIPLGMALRELPSLGGIIAFTATVGDALNGCRFFHANGPTAVAMNLFGDPSLLIEYDTGTDLFADRLSLDLHNLARSGGTVQATLRVNRMTSWIPRREFNVRFYLSEDNVIDPAADLPLGDGLRLRVNGEESSLETVDLPVPVADPFGGGGTYYIGVVVDTDDEVDEVFEDNNANQGLGIDIVPVYYHAANGGIPFHEDWEGPGAPDAWWEIQSNGSTARARVTDAFGSATGRRMVLDSTAFGWPPAVNRLILHQRMHQGSGIVNQATLTFEAKRFSPFDSLVVDTSLDGGMTWTPLLGTADFPAGQTVFQAALLDISAAVGRAWEDILIRFTHSGAAQAPHGGVAIDNVFVGLPGPEVIGRSFALTPANLSAAAGRLEVDFSFASLIDLPMPYYACVVSFFLSEDAVIDPDTDIPLVPHPDDRHDRFPADPKALLFTSYLMLYRGGTIESTAILSSPLADPFASGNRYYVGMVLEVIEANEVNPGNNANQGLGIDMAEATFVTIADYPFVETWESGDPSPSWEFRSTPGGRIAVTYEHGPANGTWHVVLDSDGTSPESPLNQLILHINLEGKTGVQLSYLNREWDDADDLEDKISISVDGGLTWRLVTLLLGRASTDRYTRRVHDLDALGLTYSSHTLIRFQQRANGRMAFDDIRVTPETVGPKVVGFSPTGRQLTGVHVLDIWFDEAMDTGSAATTDVAMFRGPDGSDLRGRINAFVWNNPQHLRLFLNPSLEQAGGYAFALAPTITDLAGNDLDNDGDGTPGETPDDIFSASFSLAAVLFDGKTEAPHPGWQLDPHAGGPGWEFGVPQGGVGQAGGPASGYDGPTVLGYNLTGTYYPSMSAEHATTPPVDATGYRDLAVSFWRWLVVESSSFDQATVASSGDGATWTGIWSNPETLLIDNQWGYQFLPLDPSCNGSSSVRVRWTMGPTNASGQYEGWYLDNLQITGIPAVNTLPDIVITDSSGDPDDRRIVFPAIPVGGGAPTATFTIANQGWGMLAIAGIQLVDDAEGEFSLAWDGDGTPPTVIAPGLARTCTVRFQPAIQGADRRVAIRIVSNDPTPGDGDTEVVCLASTREEMLYAWTCIVSAEGRQVVEDVVFDASGNVLVAGSFAGTVDFDPDGKGMVVNSKNGSADAFVAKYSSAGKLLWLWSPASSADDAALGLGVDPLNLHSQSVLVVGEFRGAIEFDPASGRGETFNSAGDADAFAVLLDENGNFLWGWTGGGPGYDSARAGLPHASGVAYVTGVFSDTANFNPINPTNLASNGGTDIFVCQFSMMSVGTGMLYGVPAVIGGSGDDIPHDLAVDRLTGSVLVVGEFRGAVDFNPMPGTSVDMRSAVGGADAFLWCLTSSLGYHWTRTWGGGLDDRATGVACNAVSEQVIVAGEFRDTVDFAPGLRDAANTWSSNGGGSMADVFVLALSRRGTLDGMDVDWSRAFGAPTSERVGEVAVLGNGDVVVVGDFSMAMDTDPGEAETVIVPVGNRDGFVVRLSQFGATVDAFNVGSLLDDTIGCVAADTVNPGGFAYGGHYRARCDFNPNLGAEDIRENAGAEDGFVSRLASREPSATRGGISGVVWQDFDGDGIRIAGEPFAGGTTLFMDTNENGVRDPGEPAATTDTTGYYEFLDLPPARYRLTIELGDDMRTSLPSDGVRFRLLELRAGHFRSGQDFAFYRHASITGRVGRKTYGIIFEPLAGWTVYLDNNGNGQRDIGEPMATTGADGTYSFPWLGAGAYSVRPVFPDNFEGSPWRASAPQTGQRSVVVAPGEHLANMDFTAYPYNVFSGTVWLDSNGNGLREPGEPGFPGVTVFNDWRNDSRPDRAEEFAVSDADGNYQLEVEARGGLLRIRFAAPDGYGVSFPTGVGYIDGDLRNISRQGNDRYDVHDNGPGKGWHGLDIGLYAYGFVFGVVFNDLNRNGIRDPGEPGVQCSVGIDGLTTIGTRSDGSYDAGPQPPGRHEMAAFPTREYDAVPDYLEVEVVAGVNLEVNFPLHQKIETTVRGKVWLDRNGDGIQDTDEPGLPGVNMYYVYVGAGTDYLMGRAVATDSDGNYEIFIHEPFDPSHLITLLANFEAYDDFAGGAVISPMHVGDDSGLDSDFEPIELRIRAERFLAQLPPWSFVPFAEYTMDLGVHLPTLGSASIRVWEDLNGNGLEDDFEPGIPGVPITLSPSRFPETPAMPRVAAVTDADGIARFSGLTMGRMNVDIEPPPNRRLFRPTRVFYDPYSLYYHNPLYFDRNSDIIARPGYPDDGRGTAKFKKFNADWRLVDREGGGEFDIGLTPLLGPADYGDAGYDTGIPADYLGHREEFAGHIIRAGLSLGMTIDAEDGGQPSENCDGDDTNGIDDEDGVVFNPSVRVGRRIFAEVAVNLPAGVPFAYLNVWTHQPGWGLYQVAVDRRLTRGVHSLPLNIPNYYPWKTGSLRFRLSTVPGVQCFGLAVDGEVEDYAVSYVDSGIPDPALIMGIVIVDIFSRGDDSVVVEAFDNPRFEGDPVARADGRPTDVNGQYAFNLELPPHATYYLRAFVDANGNGQYDPGERILLTDDVQAVTVADGDYTGIVLSVPLATSTVHLRTGWNFVALSTQPLFPAVEDVFHAANATGAPRSPRGGALHRGPVWRWWPQAQCYVTCAEMDFCQAVWVYLEEESVLEIPGGALRRTTVDLEAGWNAIGTPAQFQIPDDDPRLDATAWRWDAANQAFVPTSVIPPDTGGWLKARQSFSLETLPTGN